jgi:hypothetical protein
MATSDEQKIQALQSGRLRSEAEFEERYSLHLDNYTDDAKAKAMRRRQVAMHRHIWSFSLLGLVALLNIFSMAVVVLIGQGKLNYPASSTVPAVIAANFGETWTLTRIAMKFWFDHASDE